MSGPTWVDIDPKDIPMSAESIFIGRVETVEDLIHAANARVFLSYRKLYCVIRKELSPRFPQTVEINCGYLERMPATMVDWPELKQITLWYSLYNLNTL